MIELICAVDNNFGIGYKNTIPWKNHDDMKFFKETTVGYNVVMGTSTWDGLEKKPLPDRNNIVLSRIRKGSIDNVTYMSFNNFINMLYRHDDKYFVIGGQKIYEMFLEADLVKRIHLTYIPGTYNCDRFFPKEYLINFNMYEGFNINETTKVKRYIRRLYI